MTIRLGTALCIVGATACAGHRQTTASASAVSAPMVSLDASVPPAGADGGSKGDGGAARNGDAAQHVAEAPRRYPVGEVCAHEVAASRAVLAQHWDNEPYMSASFDSIFERVAACTEGTSRTWVLAVPSMDGGGSCSVPVQGELRVYEQGTLIARRAMPWRLGTCMTRLPQMTRVGVVDPRLGSSIAIQFEEPIERDFTVHPWRVYSLIDGRIELHPDTSDRYIANVTDVDQDGLLDLVIGDPYALRVNTCLGGAELLDGPRHLMHAQADGTFSQDEDDAVVRRFLLAQCPRPPRCLLRGNDACLRGRDMLNLYRSVHAVACARIWGWTAARAQQVIRRWCRSFVDYCQSDEYSLAERECPSLLLHAAEILPPFRLDAAR